MKRNNKGSGIGTFFMTLLLVVAIGVFCFAAWKLFGYWQAYKAGSDEYQELNARFVNQTADSDAADGADDAADAGSGANTGTETAAGANAPADAGSAAGNDASSDSGEGGSIGSILGDGGSGSERVSEGAGEAAPEASSGNKTGTSTPGKVLQNVEELEDPKTVEKKVAAAATEETVENKEVKKLPLLRNPINFTELNAINPDIVGWIRIGALDLSYPVAQAKDNDYYLHRTFEGKDNFAGCIFLNCDNSRYLTDQNSIVYGHNMKNGSMFGTLKEFRNQETYDSNPYFWIFTPTLIYQYRIFSCAEVATVGDPYRVRFTTADFQKFLDDMNSHSLIKTDVKVTTDDRIVTLSTCTGNSSTRFIVQGRLEQMYIAK